MNRKNSLFLIIAIAFLSAVFFFNKAEEGDATGYLPPKGSEKAVGSAIKLLSEDINKSRSEISVVEVSNREWIDSCLGLGGRGESCLKKSTKGYEVLLETKEVMYVVRTNLDGSETRLIR